MGHSFKDAFVDGHGEFLIESVASGFRGDWRWIEGSRGRVRPFVALEGVPVAGYRRGSGIKLFICQQRFGVVIVLEASQ